MDKKPIISLKQATLLAQKHGTPIYIYRKDIVARQYNNLYKSIKYPNKIIYFACKANSNSEILKILKRLGCKIETVSPGEIDRALKAGFKPEDISFTCSNISRKELISVARQNIRVHIDSLTQLTWWGEEKLGRNISLRINGGFGAGHNQKVVTGGVASKFGIYHSDIPEAIRIASKFKLKICGLHQHIGSNILDEKTFLKGVRLISSLTKSFPDLMWVDIGGGLGIPYKPNEKSFNVHGFGNSLTKIFEDLSKHRGRNLEVSLEPGRYLVAEAGCMLTKVTDIKKTPKNLFIGVNSGFNHLIRHAMYGSYNHVYNLSRPQSSRKNALVVGNICESGDILAEQSIPMPKIGDFLLFGDAGAYGYVMASDYNSRPKPSEIVI